MSRTKLPVILTVKETYALVLADFVSLLRAAWAPGIVMVVLNAFLVQFNPETLPYAGLLIPFGFLLLFVVMALAYVRWHRLVILGETEHDRPQFALGREERRYLLGWLVLGLLATAMAIIIGPAVYAVVALLFADATQATLDADFLMLVVTISIGVTMLCTAYLFVRLALIMPNAAIRGELEVKAMWRAARGNFWRMLSVFLIVSIPVLVVSILPSLVLGVTADGDAASMMTPFEAWWSGLVGLIAAMILVVAESLIYIKLVELPRAGAAASDEQR